jgi:glycolate oxidase subunit GlcD
MASWTTLAFAKEAKQFLGDDAVLTQTAELKTYETDALVMMKTPPDVVVLPKTTEQVQQVIRLCQKFDLPFIPRGSGTGLSGGTLPMRGGVMIGLSRMNRILKIDAQKRTAWVETGVINAWLNREAKPHGLFFAPDPSSQGACTIGGNIAENAGGIHCVKYGVTSNHVLALEVVTPEGDIVQLGQNSETVAGPDWVGLFIGSEGTFGIATKALLKLMPVAQKTLVFLASFSALTDATETVSAIIALGLQPSALEFMDALTVKLVNQAFHVGFPEEAAAVLLIELDGDPRQVAIHAQQLHRILKEHGVVQLREATDEGDRLALWKARKGTVAAYGRLYPSFYLHDCVIPRSRLTEVILAIEELAREYDLLIPSVFHAGDGNLHPHILMDPQDRAMVKRALAAGEAILDLCLSVGGVLSGEHGIGIEKSGFMTRLFTASELEVMRRLKHVFDPEDRANPEKIFPMRSRCGEAHTGLPLKILQASGVWI